MANSGAGEPLTLRDRFKNDDGSGSPEIRLIPLLEIKLVPNAVAISPGTTPLGTKLAPLTTAFTVVGSLIVPPDTFVRIGIPVPVEVEASDSTSGMVVVAEEAIPISKRAKIPELTTVVLKPSTMQVISPGAFAHESDLPAAAAASPTDALIDVTLVAGKLKVH